MITIGTVAHFLAVAGAPKNRGIWVKVGNKVQCDTNAGEKYIKDSSGKLPNIWQCKKSCEDSVECRSITYVPGGWCSHYSTSCKNHKTNIKAVSMRLDTSGWFLVCNIMPCFVCVGMQWYS